MAERGDMIAATVTVAAGQLDAVVATYQEALGLGVRWGGPLGSDLATAWGLANPARRVVVLGAEGEDRGAVRLVEGPTRPPPPLTTLGWSALELTVRDVDGLHERLRVDPAFRVNGVPHDLVFDDRPPGQRAMQVVGPAGEQLYLTEILRQRPEGRLAVPPPGAAVGAVFIAVLACHDVDVVVAFGEAVLGHDGSRRLQVPLTVASGEAGWPDDQRYSLALLQPAGETRIEVDGYPAAAEHRGRPDGELPPGFGLASFLVADLDAALAAAGALGMPALAPPVALHVPPYDGRRTAVVIGPEGILVELVG